MHAWDDSFIGSECYLHGYEGSGRLSRFDSDLYLGHEDNDDLCETAMNGQFGAGAAIVRGSIGQAILAEQVAHSHCSFWSGYNTRGSSLSVSFWDGFLCT